MAHYKSYYFKLVYCLGLLLLCANTYAQQTPQYTQYMFNTMSINPAYAGQREALSLSGMYRNQWVGLDGAPVTQTFGIHSPLSNEKIGIGFSAIKDEIGPASETYLEFNGSYKIDFAGTFNVSSLIFGIKAGAHLLNTDWSKGRFKNQMDPLFQENINQWSPLVGFGLYFRTLDWYVGVSAPNVLRTEHYNDFVESVAVNEVHYYLIGGYVYQINSDVKIKPAFLVKAVNNAPLVADVSINSLVYEKLTLGLSYRLEDAVSAIVGFQISDSLFMGYSYDMTTNNLRNYSGGSHEITLRFEIKNPFDTSFCGCPLFF